jgi:tRNA(Ile)-lysidine synthase
MPPRHSLTDAYRCGPTPMRTFSPEELHAVLMQHVPHGRRTFCVAYSGGLDSTVLLRALSQLNRTEPFELRAIHIDHQLQDASKQWSEHCKRVAEQLQIPLLVRTVVVEVGDQGLEAAARRARYDALRAELRPDEILLTAHHADDQLETVLLALMRGAGLRGLSGMPRMRAFGVGSLMRPLLDLTRAELERWARQQSLEWIEDPTNASVSMDRNYMRAHVVPQLVARWPSGPLSAVRSAAHAAQGSALLDDLARLDAANALVGECLDVGVFDKLDSARRRNLIRYWLRSFGMRAPSTRKLAALEHDFLAAETDRVPCVTLEGFVVRRHRDLLYCSPLIPDVSLAEPLRWEIEHPLELPGQLGTLRLNAQRGQGISAAKLPHTLQVSFRRGGEVIRPAGDRHHRALKKLLQESLVLPWWRGRLPLIYAGNELAAVGDLWVSEAFAARAEEPSMIVEWVGRPSIKAIR